jgi:prevent-host-death family protein
MVAGQEDNMTHQYSIDQAQTHFMQLLKEIEQGNTVALMRSGKRIAVVISSEEYDRLVKKHPDFWEAIQTFRQEFNLEEIGIDSEIFLGLRDSSPGREVGV